MEESSKKLTRRSFLATTALAAGAMATATAAGCSSVDTSGDAVDLADTANAPEESTYIATCHGNCGGRCALQATVREGKIVSTLPMTFPKEKEGLRVGCVKGVSNALRIYGPQRLMYPMKRAGERGSGEWERISWDEAIEIFANQLKTTMETYGGASNMWQAGAGNMNGFLRGVPTGIINSALMPTGDIAVLDSFSKGLANSRLIQKTGGTVLSVGHDMAGIVFVFVHLSSPQSSIEDIANAKTIVAWGANPAEASFCRTAWNWICKGRENGAKLIAIDPLYTSTAAHSDEWVPVRTGTDAALMCGMIHYIVDNDLVNWDYLKNGSIAPFLIDEAGAYLRLSSLGMAEAGSDEDVPVVWDEDAQAFVAHTEAKNPAVTGTFDANGTSVRTVFDAAMENIEPFTVEFAAKECDIPAAQIENLARTVATEGPTSFYINYGLEHTYESWRIYFLIGLLVALTGSAGIPGGSHVGSINLDHAKATHFKRPQVLNSDIFLIDDAVQGKHFTGDWIVQIAETGQWAGEDLHMGTLVNMCTNPLDNFSGSSELLKAYDSIDYIITIDSIMTTTAHYSDLVLPAAMPWEAYEYIDGGIFEQKAIEPIGEARSDFDIIKDVAVKMGYDDLITGTDLDYLRELLDTPENIEAGVGFDALFENGVVMGDYVNEAPVTPEYNQYGRTQFYMEYLMPRDSWGQTFGLQDRLPYYKPSIEAYADNPDREKYPLYGFSGHDLFHGQTLWTHHAWLDDFRKVNGKPFCRIHTEAAAERGIKTGDTVRIYNDHGTCVLSALVTEGIRKDSVWIPHGFTWDEFEEGTAQSLTRWCPDDVTSNNNFNDWICEVEKI
ncbi:MAG TPA: molybdopterin-dependent oxidoreductase [Adlercreutzia equolifaciens]|uniref:molybdopterin-containing oxidoreductase family protein n=1 Tax=Adlercreutzia equolifaciens TaxID=446660 RepID=UPI00242F2160|nr:molybdopterin-dependent oxidoreductase [Adlercreutzia equolifaciens]HJI11401.1 molybdopterin-dependent oxidoreductase [Adlercreutzia equolifaciens]